MDLGGWVARSHASADKPKGLHPHELGTHEVGGMSTIESHSTHQSHSQGIHEIQHLLVPHGFGTQASTFLGCMASRYVLCLMNTRRVMSAKG